MSKKKAVVEQMEYLDYKDKLDEYETKWIQQFYNEYYAKGSYSQEDPLLTSEEHMREANRTNNSLYRDALSVALNMGTLTELSDSQREVLELSSDEIEWEDAYSKAGERYAMDLIFKQAVRDLNTDKDKEVTLSRFYIKMEKLRKQMLKEKRKVK